MTPLQPGARLTTLTTPTTQTTTTTTTTSSPTSATNTALPTTATSTNAVDAADEPAPRRVFNPVMALLNRFGTLAPMSDAQRSRDLAYRASRQQALDAVFGSLVASPKPFHEVLQTAHKVLNEGKQFSTIMRLSGLLLRNNLENAGQFRSGPNRAGPYVAPSAKDVAPLMQAFGKSMDRLINEARTSGSDDDARLVAAWALTVMIRIHPFMDGNGRTARTVMNLALAKSGQHTIDFPSDSEGIYKQSPVWLRLKDHMRGFVGKDGVDWSMSEGVVPPSGYFDKLERLLSDDIGGASVSSLRLRPDIGAIANALGDVRQHGFSRS